MRRTSNRRSLARRTRHRSRRNPISDLSKTEIALIVGGVAVVGIAGYFIYNANYSAGAQGAQSYFDQLTGGGSSTGTSGLPRGVGQFVNTNSGAPMTSYPSPSGGGEDPPGSDGAYIPPAGPPAVVTINPDSDGSSCTTNPAASAGTGHCIQDQGNTTVPSVGDPVAIVVGASYNGGTDYYPQYGTVTWTDGVTVSVVDNEGVVVNWPLSYIAIGLNYVGAAVGL